MKKIMTLIKVSLNHDMNIFRINTKKQSKLKKILLPLLLVAYLMFLMGIYSYKLMEMLVPLHLEFAVLTFFGIAVSFITLLEGIYKSGSLLFNSKDDNLLFSLPIKKRTILFIKVFKFYVFELLYNSLFLAPAMIVYAYFVNPSWTYYLSSVVALLLLPIVPIVLSVIIGFITTYLSSKVKGKSVFQTLISLGFVFLVMYISFNSDGFVSNIAAKAASYNEMITKIYYPLGAYITLVTDFNVITLLIYILSHIALYILVLLLLSTLYFRINSSIKGVLVNHKNKAYHIKSTSKLKAFIKKELNRFFTTPVFMVNAGFGLILFVLASIMAAVRFDALIKIVLENDPTFDLEKIRPAFSIIAFGLVAFTSFMTSITSSMISLEGSSFNLLKSLPIKPIKIVMYKVISALAIMLPCILLGDILLFVKFRLDIISIILILIASFILPFLSELIGIMINLKYPKMDASTDTEAVKQSMSSLVSTFSGMGILGMSALVFYLIARTGTNTNIILTLFLLFYGIITILLYALLNKKCDKMFNNIIV